MLKRLFANFNQQPEPLFKKSYSQCGEDLIMDFILRALRIENPSYIDVGANHPIELSNTYRFYERGCQGICIEPDANLCKIIAAIRPKDLCLNMGIGFDERKEADFYIMSSQTLNTFSLEEAERFQSAGKQKIESIERVALVSLNQVMMENYVPDILSIDAEGVDIQILKTIDFTKHRPLILCVETLSYNEDKAEKKVKEINELMLQHGYMIYGDTYINTIFVDATMWKKR